MVGIHEARVIDDMRKRFEIKPKKMAKQKKEKVAKAAKKERTPEQIEAAKKISKERNDTLNKKLVFPVLLREIKIVAPLIDQTYSVIVADAKEKKKKIKRIDSNLFHFIIHDLIKKSDDPTLKSVTCGWYKHGPYIAAVDSYMVLAGGMEEHQHQLHKKSKEHMLESMIEYDTLIL